ncbi:hypothetical protein TSOC_003552 [Tetrabaena socialis]|uniref:Pentatricopeptide repeat-containing protein n=1 Tax=Tetrabaena socialis TaxID=47790 RepID=A0A2J8AB92_9CHLO|nr:hypothetical protein TSOC_003552 [Tetrabaena socialis]|eukprot:PNH09795.1 hypothetical protein TSOC_003552 [Tetrabaena socialis]
MVENSPAALQAVASSSNQRKHSPWTAGRERKKTKAECHDAADDIEEEEDDEADDHEMTEQEAQVVACLGKLNVGLLGSHSDADDVSTSLSTMASAPEGQRRKLRGFRANLSAGYHSRLRSCLLNDKGSPLARSSRSCTSGQQRAGDRGQENTPPLLFSTAEHAKCCRASNAGPGLSDAQLQGRRGTMRLPLGALGAAATASAPLAFVSTANLAASGSAAPVPEGFMAAMGAANASAAGWAAGVDAHGGGFAESCRGLSRIGAPAAASLADSAEELDLRRLSRQQPSGPTALLPEQRRPFAPVPARAPSAAPPGPATAAPFAAFDLAALAVSSGSLLSGSHGLFRSSSAAAGPTFMSAVSASAGAGATSFGGMPAAPLFPDARRAAKPSGVEAPLHAGSWQPLQPMGGQQPDANAHKNHGQEAGGATFLGFNPGSGPTPPRQLRNSGGGVQPIDQEPGTAGAGGEEDEDDEDEEKEEDARWLRTSEQAPDPDDPASAGKYSAALLRRLQQAAEHEELHGATGGHPGGLYLAAGDSGPCGYGRNVCSTGGSEPRLGSGCSSMEPSPMPRLSSRIRRLRASPIAGSGGGLPSSQTSSHLGTRSRSAGVTPGGGQASRRLRRRSHLGSDQYLSYASGGCDADGSEEDGEDHGGVGCGANADDHHMNEAGHHHNHHNGQLMHASRRHSAQFQHVQRGAASPGDGLPPMAGGSSFSLGYGMSTSFTYGTSLPGAPQNHHGLHHDGSYHHNNHPGLVPSSWLAGGSLDLPQLPRSNTLRTERGLPPAADGQQGRQSGGAMQDRAQPAAVGTPRRRRSAAHPINGFLNGLMDYDDEGVEYSTPPHTPLRGIGNGHDAATPSNPQRAPPVLRPGRQSSDLESPWRGPGGPPDDDGGGAVVQWLAAADSLESTQQFNRLIGKASNDNQRGTTERLWHEMCSRGVTPDVHTLNALLRCLSRSAADPDEAQLMVRDVCGRGGFSPNGTSQRLMEEICFRFEQLQAVFTTDRTDV